MVNNMGKLIYGVGVKDADYITQPTVDGSVTACCFYASWKRMLERCYSVKWVKKRPTYIGCTVCDEWLTFSNFKRWMESQDWKEKQLDKDILIAGNKIYSPETCVFVDLVTNSFINDSAAIRGDFPIGVSMKKSCNKFRAQCCNPFSKKSEHLGYFSDQNEAHKAWKKRKHELSCQLAALQTNEKVAQALRVRYL